MIDWAGVAFAVAVTALWFGGRWLWERRKEAHYAAQARAAHEAWRASQPPIVEPSADQLAEFERRLPELALPALILAPDADGLIGPDGTRIGGPIWLADGAAWPTGKGGRPLEFVAQLDFGAMPPLPDYPQTGLLQLFVGRDDLHGADFDAPDRGDIALLWHPDGAAGGQLVPPPHLPDYGAPDDDGYSSSPFVDPQVRAEGVALRAATETMMPRPYDRAIEALCAELGIDDRSTAMEPLLQALEESVSADRHHVGGHPLFVQQDYRHDLAYPPEKVGQPSPWRDYDRLLFQLTSRDGLQWGDVGEANVLIRRSDLLSRDFSRAILWWDCS